MDNDLTTITQPDLLDTIRNQSRSIEKLESDLLRLSRTVDSIDLSSSSAASLFRQALINGNFDIWQRGVSFSPVDTVNTFMPDHWSHYVNKDGGTLPTLTRTRELLTSGDIPHAFYYTRLTTNGAGTSLGVNSSDQLLQKVEFGVRYLCGDGKKVTVSFWARSSISSKRLGVCLVEDYGSGGSPSSSEIILTGSAPINLTSTWTKYTITFTTNTLTGKTLGTNNDDNLRLLFFNTWGTTVGNSYVQTSVSAETYRGSGTIDIAQVQLCAGDVALAFEPKSFDSELQACQRYFEKSFSYGTAPAVNIAPSRAVLTCANGGLSNSYATSVFYKVRKRTTTPTITFYNAGNTDAGKWQWYNSGGSGSSQTPGVVVATDYGFEVNSTAASNYTLVEGQWTSDAEL